MSLGCLFNLDNAVVTRVVLFNYFLKLSAAQSNPSVSGKHVSSFRLECCRASCMCTRREESAS